MKTSTISSIRDLQNLAVDAIEGSVSRMERLKKKCEEINDVKGTSELAQDIENLRWLRETLLEAKEESDILELAQLFLNSNYAPYYIKGAIENAQEGTKAAVN